MPQERSSRSWTATPSSSVYFQSSSQLHTPSSSPSTVRLEQQALENHHGRPPQYTPSVASTRPSTSHTSISCTATRPSTASGRKSRTATTSSILGLSDQQNIICALAEARGVTPSVGVAFVNVSLGQVILSQICDNQSYVKTIHKIQMASPSRIVFMSTACPPVKPSTLYSLVQELVPEAHCDAFDRPAWSETAGLDYIQTLAFPSDVEPIKVAIHGKYYAVSSFAAAMKYIEHQLAISFAPHSLRILYQPSEDTMMIDISAIQSLEIMQNIRNSKSKACLYGLLNHTSTPMGARMLRSNILQPPTRQDSFIDPRYDALEELTTKEEMFREIRKALKLFHDVERLLTKLITVPSDRNMPQMEEQISQILMLKSFLEAVPELHKALTTAQSPLLVKILDLCRPDVTAPILAQIRKIIEADVTYMKSPLDLRNQRTFAVKAGISGMLDVARQTYKELTEEIHQHVDEINEQYEINAALKFDNGRKYWLRVNAAEFDSGTPPPVFINLVRKKDKLECQTLNLVKLNVRLSDTSNEVVIRSDAVIEGLMRDLRQASPQLFRVCESVALVDMISSFAQLATTRDYVRPEATQTLALKSARHPILDTTLCGSFVPNDYYATEQYCFHVVTGCNMSGKSTYIRAVALLQIMAQIGCVVPAEYAAFPIINNIFARVSMEDSIEASLSTFSVEMREMGFILRNVDGKSLVIIDELGRGTSTRDGLAIAVAMSEALIRTKASTWFATHFAELARVLGDRPGVLNLHLAAKSSETSDGLPHLKMLYKATAGIVDDEEHYGIHLARAIGLPPSFIKKAEEVADDLGLKRELNRRSSEPRKLVARR
ncbi:MutS protein [Tolypocladium ophioglossoides CBS 100239]|uniref:DNA mismatch repair protein MSH3 n=1 Tax=Tolypocladium ophioglossoides (strain CBS 100239) TaxID=1163406 RepID=A0A0L0N7L0_TOLOC|nr:MutS protein [Tolypocladium ophioglossoides CBS 100239]